MKRFLKCTLPAVLVLGVALAAMPDTAEAGHGRRSRYWRYWGYGGDPYHFFTGPSNHHYGPHSAPHIGPHFHWNHGYHYGRHWQRHYGDHSTAGHLGIGPWRWH